MANYKYPVNKGIDGSLQTNETIQQKLTQLQEHMCNKHCKVLAIRFDITYPENYQSPNNNDDISKTMAKVAQEFRRKGYDPSYMWVREQHTSHNPHYHCAMFLNGSKTRHYHQVFASVERLWASTIKEDASGCIDHCMRKENGMLIVTKRDGSKDNYHDNFDEVHYQFSYLAKSAGKAPDNDGLRNFGMSRIGR